MYINSQLSTCVGTQSPKYIEMAQGHISLSLASLSREEYNKVQGLKSAKEVWDVLKTAHEGDELTRITKRETIEGELGRFRLRQGEEP
jgi:hypothetical protein